MTPEEEATPWAPCADADLLLPVLRERWSPREFDPRHHLGGSELAALLEAARRAPSAGNSQPWAFHAVVRDAPGWGLLVRALAGSSRPWAASASVLVVNLCHARVEDTDWEYSEFAAYDVGQAVAHMTVQAHAMGLACRQFRAFDKEFLTGELAVPPHWEILTMTAIGRAATDRTVSRPGRVPSVAWSVRAADREPVTGEG